MAHEGMVYALEEIHRLLSPGGRLIDIHPFAEAPLAEIHQGGKIIFAEPIPVQYQEDIRQADAALAQVIQRGLFVVERSAAFDIRIYGSSVTELNDYLAERDAYDDSPPDEAMMAQQEELAAHVEGLMLVAGEGAEVAYHDRARITRLRPG